MCRSSLTGIIGHGRRDLSSGTNRVRPLCLQFFRSVVVLHKMYFLSVLYRSRRGRCQTQTQRGTRGTSCSIVRAEHGLIALLCTDFVLRFKLGSVRSFVLNPCHGEQDQNAAMIGLYQFQIRVFFQLFKQCSTLCLESFCSE